MRKIKDPISQSLSIIVSSLLVVSQSIYGLPQGGVVTSGNSSITHNGNTTTVNQSSAKTTINWQSFNINANETVNFVQPNKNAIALNRVVGNERSVISGALNANGQVWLLNSNGILFNNSASINTSGFLATTKQLSDDAFNNGNYTFTHNSTADIINLGTIHVNNKGYVAMLGNHVRNEGTIEVVQGVVNMISAEEVSISFNGNSLVEFVINKASLDAIVENFGVISNNKGEVYLQAQGLNEVFKGVVNNEGIIEAQSVQDITSKVILDSNGNVLNSGTINVSNATGVGGEIRLLGDNNAINTGDLLARGLEGGFVAIASANVQANNFNVLAMDNSEENMGWYYTKENVNYGRSMESPLLSKSGTLSDTPILFNANEGQFSNGVSFGAMGSEYSVALSAAQAAMYFSGNGDVAGIQFVNANDNVQAVGLDKKSSYSNYYIGGNSVERVADYGKVKYENVYDDVDLVYYTNKAGKIEHDLIVRAHGDTSNIAYDYGDSTATLQANGDIEVRSGDATLTQKAPLSYQKTNRGKSIVGSNYTMDDEGIARINIQDAYDTSSDLIIDPILAWTQVTGGSGAEAAYRSLVNDDGIYTVGYTTSIDMFGGNAVTPHSNSSYDGFIFQNDHDGNRIWSTYYGGHSFDIITDLDIDNTGVYTTGVSASTNLTTIPSGGQIYNTFVAKFNKNGTFAWDVGIGGNNIDFSTDIKVDNGYVYAIGYTGSTQLNINGTLQGVADPGRTFNSYDAYILKLDETNGSFVWLDDFGGNGREIAKTIDIHNGYIYLAGSSTSTTLNGVSNPNAGDTSAFITRVDTATGTIHDFTNFIGGNLSSDVGSIKIYDNHIYIEGETKTAGLESSGNTHSGNYDIFLAKYDLTGNEQWFKYYGGTGEDYAHDLAVNQNGIYVSGNVKSSGLDPNGKTTKTGTDFERFIAKFDSDGDIEWFDYLTQRSTIEIALYDENIYVTSYINSPTWDVEVRKYWGPNYVAPLTPAQKAQLAYDNLKKQLSEQTENWFSVNMFDDKNKILAQEILDSVNKEGIQEQLFYYEPLLENTELIDIVQDGMLLPEGFISKMILENNLQSRL